MKFQAIALVLESLDRLTQDPDRVICLFYGRLLILDPALHALFPEDSLAHGRRFLEVFHQAVSGLYTPEIIIPLVKDIGQAHARHGVQPCDYHTFGQALLWTLAQIPGDAFTTEVYEAWTEAYYLLAGLMKEAAAGVKH